MGSVRKRGKKWYYSFEMPAINGKRKRVERVGGDTKKEALAALRKAEDEIECTGSFVQESDISFSDFLDIWIDKYVKKECAFRTIQYYSNLVNKHIKPALGHYKLKNITSMMLQDFLLSKKTNGFSKSSVISMKGVLSSVFRYAVVPSELIKNNPMLNVQLPNFSTYQDKIQRMNNIKSISILSDEDIERIFIRFGEDSNMYLPTRIAYHTGMRAGEVCALQWSDIDLDSGIINVNKTLVDKGMGIFELGPTKTKNSTRAITIGSTLINILKKRKIKQNENRLFYGEYYNINDFVCKKPDGTPITTNSIKYLSRIVNYELKIDFNFHMFRHTHATMLVQAGAEYKDIQERLGHSKLETTMNVYAKSSDFLRKDTIEKFEKIINDI